jgi:hypothetical protein
MDIRNADIQRILRHFQQAVASEKKKSSPSIDRIKTIEEMMDFINNADKPKDNERADVKEIFQKHHVASKGTRYVFTKNQEHELDELIIQIKQEMAENTEQYGEITVAQFFELFMNNMDEWWKKHQFTTWGINKQFRKILSQILSNRISSNNKTGSGKKPSYSSVMNH